MPEGPSPDDKARCMELGMSYPEETGTPADPVQSALDEFRQAWFSGKRLDPEEFCRSRSACAPELAARIQDFLYVAEGLADLTRDPCGAATATVTERTGDLSGAVLGDFRVLHEIGRGGMGMVFEAEQISLKRRVALKILPSYLSLSDVSVQKFHREAEAGSRKSHPGIVAVYAVGEHGGRHYIAQELVEGGATLASRIDARRRRPGHPPGQFREVAELFVAIADALEHAHQAGVIHRDIKPSNILLTADGRPKVTDFGLAMVEGALALSRSGEFAGTPFYMSPEQALSRRQRIDKRTDIYSLGVTLYEVLTLQRPFDGEDSHEVLRQIVLAEPRDPRRLNPRLPRDLAVICLKAMDKAPQRRYQTMRDLAADLERYLAGDVILARPAGVGTRLWKLGRRHPVPSAAGGVGLLAIVGFVSYLLLVSYPAIRTERDRAVAAQKKAEDQRELADDRYKQIIRLADLKWLSDLEKNAETLWPAYPEKITGLKDWLARADELIGRLDGHRAALQALREQARPYDQKARQRDLQAPPRRGNLLDPKNAEATLSWLMSSLASERRTWEFDDTERQWQHDSLAGLVQGIESLMAEDGIRNSIEDRLAFAATVEEKSITAHQEDWDRAIASITSSSECPQYRGLAISPQIGLVPIGRDPDSGLFEFADLQTGAVPERSPKGKLVLTEDTGLVFVLIPGGTFTMGAVRPSSDNPMGSPNVDPQAQSIEAPAHEVAIRPFFLSKYEMTQGQWFRHARTNPSRLKPGVVFQGERYTLLHPVEFVTWDDCVQAMFRLRLRLPSESEWEYAARAGTTTIWWSGDNQDSLYGAANLKDKSYRNFFQRPVSAIDTLPDDTHVYHAPVGCYLPNQFGLHDTCGNVWEWCHDTFGLYGDTPEDGSPFEGKGLLEKVMRGGGWSDAPVCCRSTHRESEVPEFRYSIQGLRPARSLDR